MPNGDPINERTTPHSTKAGSMTWRSGGESQTISPVEAKINLGRTSFIRGHDHQGRSSDETLWQASAKVDKSFNTDPTPTEIKYMLQDFPVAVERAKRQYGTDDLIEIYKYLEEEGILNK